MVRLVKEEARERRGGRDPMETGGRRGGTAFQASRGWAVSLATVASPAKEESGYVGERCATGLLLVRIYNGIIICYVGTLYMCVCIT